MQGLVGFVSHGNATYQLVGYAPAQRYAASERVFLSTLDSFGPLEDPSALNAQPKTIEIIRLPRAMSLQEFARVYPSGADIKTVALINEVADPAAQLPAGKRIKRVVGK